MHWITIVGALFTILCGVMGFVDGVIKKGKFKTTCAYLTFFFAAFTISFVYNSGSIEGFLKKPMSLTIYVIGNVALIILLYLVVKNK